MHQRPLVVLARDRSCSRVGQAPRGRGLEQLLTAQATPDGSVARSPGRKLYRRGDETHPFPRDARSRRRCIHLRLCPMRPAASSLTLSLERKRSSGPLGLPSRTSLAQRRRMARTLHDQAVSVTVEALAANNEGDNCPPLPSISSSPAGVDLVWKDIVVSVTKASTRKVLLDTVSGSIHEARHPSCVTLLSCFEFGPSCTPVSYARCATEPCSARRDFTLSVRALSH